MAWLAGGLWLLALLRLGAAAESGVVKVDGSVAIASTGEFFVCATLDWWPADKCDYGTCSWGSASLLNLDLSNELLLNAVRAFSPLLLRLGGTLQDKVLYHTPDDGRLPCVPFAKNSSATFGFTRGCLTMARWDELNAFFQKSGAKVVFGLNALNGRDPDGGSYMGGSWDMTNAASFIQYTVSRGYEIHGWELGNELGGKAVGTSIAADQYAKDATFLKWVLEDTYEDSPSKPLLLAPGSFFDEDWFGEFITKTSPDIVSVVSHHIYNLEPGVSTDLVDRILNPTVLDGVARQFSDLQGLLKTAGTSAVAWVGEAGGAYNSGHHLVTDAFVFSFWYLDQLGMSAKYGTKTYCRQSFIGGNYGLLNTTTFQPNPDYYSALLWHRLMGTKVLDAKFSGTSNLIRAYAHCAKNSPGITLLLINLHGNARNDVSLTSEELLVIQSSGATREEYHLLPEGGNIHSQVMLLNGRALTTDAGNIPRMEPIIVDAAQHISIAPLSIAFVHMPNYYAPACS
ncbi:heparanase [Hordeum vulgare]|nr:heparanase [Hordeum vulgare]